MDEDQNIPNPQDAITDAIEATGAQQASDDSLVFLFPTDPSTAESEGGISERRALLDDPLTGQATSSDNETPGFEDSPLSGQTTNGLTGQPVERGLTYEEFFTNPAVADEILRRAGRAIENDLERLGVNFRDFLSEQDTIRELGELADFNDNNRIDPAEVGVALTAIGVGASAIAAFGGAETTALGLRLAYGLGAGIGSYLTGLGADTVTSDLTSPTLDNVTNAAGGLSN